jgi:superfamily II DNA or RNA helicase
VKVKADNVWAVVEEATSDELAWLESYLTVPIKGAEYSDAFAMGVWDGSAKLYDAKRRRLGSGLLRLVAGRAREAGVSFQVEDARQKPQARVDEAAGAWLRDYQKNALGVMLARGRGIVALPTGGGKTELFAALAAAVPIRWLVLVDTKDLMHQAADRFYQRTGERAGVAGDGEWQPRRFTVATLQTLLAGLGEGGPVDQLLEGAQGIVGDEVQVLSASEFRRVAMACRNAWWRFGLSATPLEREDEADYRAIEALGPLIHDVHPRPLIDAGWLAEPEVVMVRHQHEKMTGSFGEVYEAGVVLNKRRNAVVAKISGSPDLCWRPALVFFKTIAHGRSLKDQVEEKVRVDMVSGSAPTSRRNSARHRLRVGLTDVLLTSKIFNKGIDIPEAEAAVNAAGGASRIDALQKVGRLMRVEGSKRRVRYWDFMDLGNRWLEGHAVARRDAYLSRGYRVTFANEDELNQVARWARPA